MPTFVTTNLRDAPGKKIIVPRFPGTSAPGLQAPIPVGLVTGATIQSGISNVNAQGGGGINNTEEYNVSWVDANGNGWRIGMIPGYGGALLSTWYEIDAFKVGISQTYLGTTNPDDLYHWFSQDPSFFFSGSENAPYTSTFKELPGGSNEHRYYDSGTIAQPVAGVSGAALNWRVRMAIQPGDPGMMFVRMDVTNPSGSTVALNTTGSIESDWPSGLTTALQNGVTAWQSGNGLMNTVGGTAQAWSAGTVFDPDGAWITPAAGSGISLAPLVARKNSLLQITGSANATTSFATSGPPGRLKNGTTVDIAAGTFPASTTYTFYLLVALRRNLTTADANSMIADYLTPDTSGILSIGIAAASPLYSYDEGRYMIQAAPWNVVTLTHTISGNVTARWNPAYKISNWQDTSGYVSVTIGGVQLSQNSDFITNVDTANQILYLKFMRPIVASGATGNQLNNGQIVITGGSLQPQLAWSVPVLNFRNPKQPFRPFKPTFISTGVNNFFQSLSGTLTFTGPTNLTKAISKGVSGGLSFTGPTNLKNAITKLLTGATLTFTGPVNLVKAIAKLLSGTLTFTGPTNLVKAIVKGMTGVLSFTGPTNLKNAISKGLSGTLTFTGPTNLKNAITKGLSATLSFNGAFVKAITKGLTAATLNFNGVLTSVKQFNRAFTATLTFTGPSNLKNAISKQVSGTLTFTGAALGKNITKGITATLSFTGAFIKGVSKSLSAGLSFVGSQVKQIGTHLIAQLSFTGSSPVKAISKSITAALTFVGNLAQARFKGIGLAASVSFQGGLTNFRWYTGIFKQASIGFIRAVYRGINSFTTKNRNLP